MRLSAWDCCVVSFVCRFILASLLICAFTVPASGATNLALNQPVVSSAENWGNFKPAALTDGDPTTFTHPLAATGTRAFYYEVDLGRVVHIDRIVLRNRGDGCCPQRLSNFRVEIYDDRGGSAGAMNWGANIRINGSHSGVSGKPLALRKTITPAFTAGETADNR